MTPLEEVKHLADVPVGLVMELDRKVMPLSQVLDLEVGSVVWLTRSAGEAIASSPTERCVPLEYCAMIWPPSASPTFVSEAAVAPSCAFAVGVETWLYCVIRGTPATL